MNFFKAIFGSKNDRDVKKIRPVVARINEIEAGLQKFSDEELRAKTAAWKAELSKIEDNAELAAKLEEILPEAFAVVKNACRRLCGTDVMVREHPIRWEMVPFDVQLIGGYSLHTGHIAEMATGEG
ncbi:MAG TPA: preprotein translocase subunit SecA, partial [Verrucomicrobiae bacterium]